jgi:hypothetical protein
MKMGAGVAMSREALPPACAAFGRALDGGTVRRTVPDPVSAPPRYLGNKEAGRGA